jgi:transcriptional regulator with XRE-family HTH domain
MTAAGRMDEAALYLAVGARFRAARRRAGMAQAQVGQLVNLSRGAVANIELGHQAITLAMFLNLCDALSIEPAEILGGGQ